jgi:hypothetical protein
MNEPQHRMPPLPLAQAFVVCRDIIEDCRSHDFVLIAPFSAAHAVSFPCSFRMSIYAHLTCGHGTYALRLELRNGDDQVLWAWDCPQAIRLDNPLAQHRFTLYDAVLEFPEPGKYDLVMLANGAELARHALHARVLPSQK